MDYRIVTEGDSIDICRRGMALLRERGLDFEVGDRENYRLINLVFEEFELGFEIVPMGDTSFSADWFELVASK